jgi:hypothetical protein
MTADAAIPVIPNQDDVRLCIIIRLYNLRMEGGDEEIAELHLRLRININDTQSGGERQGRGSGFKE